MANELTAKQKDVMNFLQENEGGYFGDEIAGETGLNPKGIHGVMNGLVKRELVEKTKTPRTVQRKNKDGEMVDKETEATAYSLTAAGTEFTV